MERIMVISEVVQTILVIVLFIITICQSRRLTQKDSEIYDLRTEIDRLNYNVCKEQIKLTEQLLATNKKIIPIMTKVQNNFKIGDKDKLHLLEFFILFMQNVKRDIIYKVDTSKKFTFKQATDIILEFIKQPIYTDEQIKDVLNSIYFLLTK